MTIIMYGVIIIILLAALTCLEMQEYFDRKDTFRY